MTQQRNSKSHTQLRLGFAYVIHDLMLTFARSLRARKDHCKALPGWILLKFSHSPSTSSRIGFLFLLQGIMITAIVF